MNWFQEHIRRTISLHHGRWTNIHNYVLYVDGLLLTVSCEKLMDKVRANIRKRYMVRLGSDQSKFLGMVIEDVQSGIFAHSYSAAQKLLSHFSVTRCKPCDTPLLADFGAFHHK